MNTDTRPWVRRHWWIIYHALVARSPAEEIALHTGVSTTTVHRVIATYNRLGPAAMETPGKGGRRHEYLTRAAKRRHSLLHSSHKRISGEIAIVARLGHGAR
jgi:hypothetical protein